MSTSSQLKHVTLRRKIAGTPAVGGGCCGPEDDCCGGAGPESKSGATPAQDATVVRVQVFDPAMCCSTGVCGPSVDPRLVRFAADLEWLAAAGVRVERFNLAQQALAFATDAGVKAALQERGEAALPLVKVDGKMVSTGAYPDRDQLAAWVGLDAPAPSIYSEAVQELVAIGAAVASNCEPCFRFHFDRARRLGVSQEDMLRAVRTAQGVKETPAKAVLQLAERYLKRRPAGASGEDPGPAAACEEGGPSGCCG